MRRIHVFAPAFALALGACATPVADQDAGLAKQAVCCKSPSEFTYADLMPDRAQKVTLGPSAPVFDFPQGRSYFAGFRVDGKPSRRINVESEFNGGIIGQYLHPIFLFLDAQQRPVATIVPQLRFRDASLIPYSAAHMQGAVDVPENARFVVVHTGKLEGTSIAKMAPSVNVVPGAGNPFVMYSPGAQKKLDRSPTGELKLQLVAAKSR